MPDFDALSRNFWSDESAVSAIEYAILAGIVAAALVAVFGTPENGVISGLAPPISEAVNQTANSGTGG